MSSLTSRNILLCVVPTVIVLFSVYWLRKKKKIKSDAQYPDASTVTTFDKCSSSTLLQDSHNGTQTISDGVNEIKSKSVAKRHVSSFVQCDNSAHITDTSISVRNLKCKDESFDSSFSDGLSLLSNHVENASSFYANNVSFNSNKLTIEDKEVPNFHVTHISKSQLENTESESSPNESSEIAENSPSPVHSSEIKSDNSESGIIDVSRISFVGDESESIDFTDTSEDLTSPVQVQLKQLHELETNEDATQVLQNVVGDHCDVNQVLVEHDSDSEGKDSLISVFKEIIASKVKIDSQMATPHLQSINTQESSNLNLRSSPDDVSISTTVIISDQLADLVEESEVTNSPTLSVTGESGVCEIQVGEAVLNGNNDETSPQEDVAVHTDDTDGSTVPNCSSSESTATCVSEEMEKPDLRLKEMDITQHFNMNSNANINVSSWKTSDVQRIAVLNSNKLGESLIDFKMGTCTGQYVYEFDLHQDLCGRLIGRQGKTVKSIKEQSNANVFIKRHPYEEELKVVVVEGHRCDVDNALELIRRKYPPSQYPTVSLEQTNVISTLGVPLPENLPLHLPDGASCNVLLSSLVEADHFFLQQPTHPTYSSLGALDRCMSSCYSQLNTPLLPQPVEEGVICAAPVLPGWYRAQIIYASENGSECGIKFVDYGGFSTVLTSSLRQIRSDFMVLPFQATECFLANVKPINREIGWTTEARDLFEELAQGQLLHAVLVDYKADGCPCVHLYREQGISNVFINRELVEQGHAVWVDNHWDPH